MIRKYIFSRLKFLFSVSLLATPYIQMSASLEKNAQKHVLFIVGGGSHIHPTYDIVKKLCVCGARVTYLLLYKESPESKKLHELGVEVLSLPELLRAANPHLSEEQKYVLQNPSYNFVDQPEGAEDTAILSQYLMALFWEDLLKIVKNIKPHVIVADATQGYWGTYAGRVLQIPTFVSFPAAFYYPTWKDPLFRDFIKNNYFKKVLPATPKRIWAATYLREILGDNGTDIDVDFPVAFSDSAHATFVYTYPKFINYCGERFLDTDIVFAGYPDGGLSSLTKEQKDIVDAIIRFKDNKKLVLVSMGTDASKPLEFFALLGEALGNSSGNNKEKNKDIIVAIHPGPKIAKVEQYKAEEIIQYMQELGHTNFVVYDYYPLPHLFKHVDVFIGHGGHNSSMQALKNYVPMLLTPVHSDQLIVGEKFQELGFAKTISDAINPMKCKDDFSAWDNFVSDATQRAEFVSWIQQSVYELLNEVNTAEKYAARKQKIDAMLESDQGYDKIIDLILSAKPA